MPDQGESDSPHLAFDPARSSLAEKLFDLLDRAAIHVAEDGVLQPRKTGAISSVSDPWACQVAEAIPRLAAP